MHLCGLCWDREIAVLLSDFILLFCQLLTSPPPPPSLSLSLFLFSFTLYICFKSIQASSSSAAAACSTLYLNVVSSGFIASFLSFSSFYSFDISQAAIWEQGEDFPNVCPGVCDACVALLFPIKCAGAAPRAPLRSGQHCRTLWRRDERLHHNTSASFTWMFHRTTNNHLFIISGCIDEVTLKVFK